MEHNDGVEVLPVEKEEAWESPDEKGGRWTEAEAADVELDLPQPLQDLLSRLSAGSMSSDAGLLNSLPPLRDDKFGDFFRPEGRKCPTRTNVRLQVLEALGNCRTLRRFDSYRVQDWNLTESEWKALMIPMQQQPNCHLEVISISAFKTAQEAELIGPYLAKLISQSQKLSKLDLFPIDDFLKCGEFSAEFAAEIASGVRARARVFDQLLELWCGLDFRHPGQQEEVLLIAADIVSSAPKLKTLGLVSSPGRWDATSFLSGHVKEALANALSGLASLKLLRMHSVHKEMVDVVADVYTGTSSNALERLILAGDMSNKLTAEALALFIRGKITTICLKPDLDEDRPVFPFRPDEWQDIERCLFQAPTLVKFELSLVTFGISKILRKSVENALLELSNTLNPLLHIDLAVESEGLSIAERALDYPCLKMVRLFYCPLTTMEFRSFVDKLASNSSMEELRMVACESSSKDGWTYLFSRLRNNTSITVLDLRGSRDLDDDNFRDVIDLLQVNYTLKSIRVDGTVWKEDGKMALIQAALQRNTKQERYFADLREAKLSFDGAKAGRIFFCGTAFAGKTTLKVTMMETMGKKSKSESVYNWKKKVGKWVPKFQRTTGIEVELLCGDQSATISVWDLAGQEIFRALQHLLFPRINQACIFVFVFNPFEGKGKNRTPKSSMQQAFAEELRSWLRFVVSNCQITGRILPQMLVIITHKDKLETWQRNMDLTITGLNETVKKLQQQYKDVVNLCPDPLGDGITNKHHDHDPLIYQVNAKVKMDVEPIKALLLRSMIEMLERKSPIVPRACSELVSHLLGRPDEVQRSPLWSSEQFYKFCSKHTALKGFAMMDKRGRRVLHAVASCMHDAGAICMTPSAVEEFDDIPSNNPKKSVVVDLNWLTQNFLGKIISHGHRFDVQSGRASTSYPSDVSISFDGFIDWEELFDLIETILEEKPRQDVNKDALKELIFELDLCYRIRSKEGPDRVFMPLLFGASKGIASTNLRWSAEPAEGSDHFGFCVQCIDKERTSLSAGFYPRYQIHLRKQMGALGVIDDNFIFSRYNVEIRHNGCLILVEIDQSAENHIDIMVRFSKKKPRDWAMEFVQEYVVKDLVQFGASEKGCPGMQLLVLILRTECVKQLTPRHLRTEAQAVAREELKKGFHDEVESRLGKDGVQSNSLFGYQHTWSEIRTTSSSEAVLPLEFQAAETLLSSKDVNDVLVAVQKDHEDFWENLQELYRVSSRLNDPSIKLELPGAQPAVKETSIQRRHGHHSLALLASRPSFTMRDDVSVGEKLIIRGIAHLEETIIASLEEVKGVLRNFQSSLNDMRSRMSDLTSKVDKIIGYEKSKEAAGTPRRPYFTTTDVSRTGRVKAAVFRGKAVRLHLMCEARHRPHFVENQAGLELQFDKEDQFSKCMRRLSVLSLYMIWVLLKVGAQVAAGAGSVIPDISNLAPEVPVGVTAAAADLALDHLELQVRENLPLVEDQRSVKEAWSCLKDYLVPYLTADKCANLFKLHKVKYRDSSDPFAWLCESCMLRGRRNFLLEP